MSDLELKKAFLTKKTKVMSEIEGILKKGDNKTQGYKYVEDYQVLLEIRRAFIKYGMSFDVGACKEPTFTHDFTTSKGAVYKHLVIELELWLSDNDTGYSQTYKWYGTGIDSMDKAIYKAYTSGIKYWLLKEFLVPTANSVEAFETEPEPDTVPLPNEKESAFIEELFKKLVDSAPEGMQVSEQALIRALYQVKGMYPTDLKSIPNAVEHFRLLMNDICVTTQYGPIDNLETDFPG